MGINHLRLSSELIAALYPESLVEENRPSPANENVRNSKPVADKTPAYHFLGENNRSICFLANYPEGDFLPENQLEFLKKMLTACKLSFNDIALLNIAHTTFDLADLRLQLHPLIIFLWGIPPESVGLKSGLPDFNITILDGISIIPVSGPDVMSGNLPEGTEFKQRLWNCLKKLFTL
ncbi:MAG TPA: hypothetical protein VFI33_20315 [Puia sp.]|nr:hypothetical protein [Puia sp.]